jgi:hypothetical protein
MSAEEWENLQKIVEQLQVILDDLTKLEHTTDDSGVKQATLSTAMALAWIDLSRSSRTNGD